MAYLGITERLDAIRAGLKEKGWSRRDVSVRKDPCTHSWSITATIRRRGIPLSDVREIVQAFQKIDRCEMTGDILSGGNTYTTVEYAWDVLNKISGEIGAEVAQAFEEMKRNPQAKRMLPGNVEAFYDAPSGEVVAHALRVENSRNLWAGNDSALLDFCAQEVVREPVTVTTEGVTVTTSTVREGNVEVRFPSKPDAETRAGLKACGFRWSRPSGCWYGKRDQLPQDLVEFAGL